MKTKTVGKAEIMVLCSIVVLLIMLCIVVIRNDALDVPLHDTYFVINHAKEKILPFFILLLISVFYIIREAFYGYKRIFQNIVMLVCLFSINLILLFWVNFFHKLTPKLDAHQGGWTIYPPLSALPKAPVVNPLPNSSLLDEIGQILLIIQIFFVLLLVIIAVLTGKSWNIKQSGTKIL